MVHHIISASALGREEQMPTGLADQPTTHSTQRVANRLNITPTFNGAARGTVQFFI